MSSRPDAGRERWRETTRADAVGGQAERREVFRTTSDIVIEDLYTPADIAVYGLHPVLPASRTVEVLAFCSWSACRMNSRSSASECSESTS